MALAAAGVQVIVSGRSEERGAAVLARITAAGGHATFLAADLGAGVEAVNELARRANAVANGPIDILVNNAGIFPPVDTLSTTEAIYDAVFDVNVKATFFLTAAIVPAMLARGSGVIINVSSTVATHGSPGVLYGATKAAITLMTKGWAADYGPRGIRVNAVSPGLTHTEGTGPARTRLEQLAETTPARRVAQPEEIAAAVLFLASDDASFIHGTILAVDGGRSAL